MANEKLWRFKSYSHVQLYLTIGENSYYRTSSTKMKKNQYNPSLKRLGP